MSRRLLVPLLLAAAHVASCGAGGDPEVRTGARTPLRVLHYSPVGTTEGQVQIHVVFDRPIVPSGMTEAPPGTIQIQPRVPGTLHAVGASAVVFLPDDPLPRATRFRVEIPEGVLATDNSSLPAPVRFTFETERPRVVELIPAERLEGLREDQPFLFKFDQPVDPAELARRTTFAVGNQTVPALAVVDAADPSYLRVTPSRPLLLGSSAVIAIDGAIVGKEGALPMGRAFQRRFTVHGLPGIASVRCVAERTERCPRATIALATPMAKAVVERSLGIEPSATIAYPTDEPRISTLDLTAVRPSTRYRVTLGSGATDIFGKSLTEPAVVELTTPALAASISPAFTGHVLPLGWPREVGFIGVNMGSAALRAERLGPEQISRLLRADDPLPGQLAYARRAPLAFSGRRDEAALTRARLDAIVGTGSGVFGWALEDNPERLSPLVVTDLDVHALWSARGGRLWVTTLSAATPVPGARIEVRDERGRTLGVLQTDGEGQATIPPSLVRAEDQRSGERFLLVSHGDDIAFVQGPTRTLGSSRFASILTDQAAYVRGQTVHVKGATSASRPGSASALVRARGQAGTFGPVRSRLTALGTFEASLAVPTWAALGWYEIEASDPEGHWSATAQVQLRASPESTPTARIQFGREFYVRGQMAVWQVQASLPGRSAPAGAAVEYRVVGQPAPFRPPGHPTFTFGTMGSVPSDRVVLAQGSGTTGDDGTFAESVRLDPTSGQATQVRIEANLAGVGRAAAETWAHPASVYLGLRAGPRDARGVPIEIVAVNPSGNAAPRLGVEITAVRQRFASAEGGARAFDEAGAGHCRVTTGEGGRGSCRLRLNEPGAYLVAASADDSRANTARSSIYVLREGIATLGDTVAPQAALVAATPEAQVGQSARLLVAAPFEGARAFLAIGVDGNLGTRVATVPRGISIIEVPIVESMRPRVHFDLYLAGPRGQVVRSSTEVFVAASDRALVVDVQPDAAQKLPGDRLELGLRVRGADGAAVASAELTVAAVAEARPSAPGSTSLDAAAQDPLSFLYSPHLLPTSRAALRPDVVHPRTSRSEPEARSAPDAPAQAAADPDLGRTIYWNADITTDPDGRAIVRFPLPEDASGTYRILAIAVASGGRVGAGRATVTAQGGVRLRPRVVSGLRAGDETTAVVSAVNETTRPVEIDVTVQSHSLAIRPPLSQQLTVPPSGAAEARFEMRAVRPGPAELSITGAAGTLRTRQDVHIDVGLGGEEEVRVISGRVAGDSSTIPLDIPGDAAADVGAMSWVLSLDAAAPAASVAQAVVEPRRDDAASLAGALVGRAFLAKNARKCGVGPPADNADRATELARRIAALVTPAGHARHFRAGPTELALGAWLGAAMGWSRSAGLSIPRRLAAPATFSTAQAPLVTWSRKLQALPFAPLARSNGGTPSVVDAAFRLLTGPGDDGDALAGVLTSAIRRRGARSTIVPAFEERSRGTSTVRATAVGLLGLYASPGTSFDADALVRGLLGLRERGAYPSSEDAALALMAFDANLARVPRDRASAAATLLLDGTPVASAELSRAGSPAVAGELPISMVLGAHQDVLQIRRRGSVPVYYDLVLRYSRLGPQAEPAEAGLAIERIYERARPSEGPVDRRDLDMPERSDRAVSVEGLMRVHLRVANGVARRNVVLDDALPAGFERIAEAAPPGAGPFVSVDGAPRGRAELYAAHLPPGIHHLSYLALALHSGRYFAPGAEVQVLGNPRVSGRSSGDVIEIR